MCYFTSYADSVNMMLSLGHQVLLARLALAALTTSRWQASPIPF